MPLATQPNRGYTDWRRVDDWDSATLWTATAANTQATFTSPILDVSRYAYLGGEIQCGFHFYSVSLQWFHDPGATVVAGFRTFLIDQNIFAGAQIRIPNLGPFLQVTISAVGAVFYDFLVDLIGTNRVHPLEFIPTRPWAISQVAVAIPAGGNIPVFPQDYYAGPVRVFMFCSTVPMSVDVQVLQFDGVYHGMGAIPVLTANSWMNALFTTPPGAWRVNVSNSGAAGVFYLTATFSMTGSA